MIAGLDPREDYMRMWTTDKITIQVVTHRVLDSSKGLAEITLGKYATVQLIHESVRDFLIKDNGLCTLSPGPANQLESSSHEQLKQCCYKYLQANFFTSADCSGLSDVALGPFSSYAATYVLSHANDAAGSIDQLPFLRELNLQSLVHAINETADRSSEYSPNASLIYVLAEHHAARLIRVARENGWSDLVKGERYLYPHFAAFRRDEETVLTLLGPVHHDEALPNQRRLQTAGSSPLRHVQHEVISHVDHNEGRSEILPASSLDLKLGLRDAQGRNALCWAAHRGFVNATRLILAAGQRDENSGDENGRRALSYAAESGSTSILKLLFDHGADVHSVDKDGKTAIHWSTDFRVIRLLLEHHADINARQKDGTTALHHASNSDDISMASELILRGADIEAADADGHTPLHHASAGGLDRTVSLLSDHNARLEAVDRYGMTALLWAVASGFLSTLTVLLRVGADLHRIDNDGNTALMLNFWNSRNISRFLLDQGLNVDAANRSGVTILMYAAQKGDEILVQDLLTRVADIDARDDYGCTALLHAILCGRAEAVRILLLNGANVHAADHTGSTALMLAIDLNQHPKGLITALEIRTRKPKAPKDYQWKLMLLEQQNKKRRIEKHGQPGFPVNRINIIRLLLEHGAQPHIPRKDGKTAITLAREREFDEVVQCLEKHVMPA